MAFNFTSANPVSVTQNGVTTTYSTWVIVSHSITIKNGIPSLNIQFGLSAGNDVNGNPILMPGYGASFVVANLLTDSLATTFAAFVSAIIAQAVSEGVIA